MSSPSETSVSALVARIRNGDAATVGRLMDRFRGYLKLLAEVQLDRKLRAKVDPSDVVQHTYLEAFRDFGQFRGGTEGEFAAWLRQILSRNLAGEVRRYRGTQRRDVRLERSLNRELDASSLALDRGLAKPGTSPSQHAMHRENAVVLADALMQLPEDYRQVILLRHIKGKSFPEVAAEMGRTQDSVRHLWTRAIARLRTHMGADR
jgi:RNA polymerase sigma-70 factor (ECF subfamily)